MILSITSSSPFLGIILLNPDGTPVKSFIEKSHNNHASFLKEIIPDFVKDFNITKCIVDRGPGSFTGIRIGLSFVLGYTLAKNLPKSTFSFFELLSSLNPNNNSFAIESGLGQVYFSQLSKKPTIIPKKDIPKNCSVFDPHTITESQIKNALITVSQSKILSPSENIITPLYIRKPNVTKSKKKFLPQKDTASN